MLNKNKNKKPITLITGFLGSGKTTYLNTKIRKGDISNKSLIIINDFGSINIDYQLIENDKQKVVKLTNGCICCSINGTLSEQLFSLELESWFESINDIYIETSGIANPRPIIDTINLSDFCYLKKIVTLVDSSQIGRWSKENDIYEIWRLQILVADEIIFNRVDDDFDRDKFCKKLGGFISISNIKLENRISVDKPTVKKINSNIKHSNIITATFDNVSILDKSDFEEILFKNINGLFRLKGFVKLKSDYYLIQLSGSNLSWYKQFRPAKLSLVAIGRKSISFENFIQDVLSFKKE